jgi:threonine synthase
MGLPIEKLVCASNMNNVLTDFLKTGRYNRNRDFHATISPSMDILISSNLERLLFLLSGMDDALVREWMGSLSNDGAYNVNDEVFAKLQELFDAGCCDDDETKATIAKIFKDKNYLCDTHTAVGVSAAERYCADNKDGKVTVVDSTASPYKFAADVYTALGKNAPEDQLDALEELSEYTKTDIAYPLKGLATRKVRFDKVIEADEMPAEVLKFAK